jgi:hypothetical protein
MKLFTYFEEFNHLNQVQKFAYCRLQCIIYLPTTTPGTGTLIFTENSPFVTGNGTTFTTELQVGSIIKIGEFVGYVRDVIDNTNLELFQVSTDTIPMPGIAFDIVDDEREYLFRGLIEDSQQVNANLVVEAIGPLHKLENAICVINMEAFKLGAYKQVQLRWAPQYDVGTGGQYTYEVDPTVGIPIQTWAEDIFGNNRPFVLGVIELYSENPPGVPVGPVSPSEFLIDCPYGLVRFHNDQTGTPLTYFILELWVYLEGTLELADIIEYMLQYDSACTGDPDDPGLGPGFANELVQTPLSGNFNFINNNTAVTGIGCAFNTELTAGDRFGHDATPEFKGIVASIAGPNNLTLKYPYFGGTAGPLPGFKSSLRESEITLSNINWKPCDGTCADLLRHLQEYYADSKGYRIWYDPMENLIRGERVAISDTDIIDLGPKTDLRITTTTENFASAIAVQGIYGRAKNLATDAAVVLNEVATVLPGVGADTWHLGAGTGQGTIWGGLTWLDAGPPKDRKSVG